MVLYNLFPSVLHSLYQYFSGKMLDFLREIFYFIPQGKYNEKITNNHLQKLAHH